MTMHKHARLGQRRCFSANHAASVSLHCCSWARSISASGAETDNETEAETEPWVETEATIEIETEIVTDADNETENVLPTAEAYWD